jgi:hypothetical protein
MAEMLRDSQLAFRHLMAPAIDPHHLVPGHEPAGSSPPVPNIDHRT